jgi:hypothetical protein
MASAAGIWMFTESGSLMFFALLFTRRQQPNKLTGANRRSAFGFLVVRFFAHIFGLS